MKFLANENFPLYSVHAIRSKGYDIVSITESSPGISDSQVMEIAMKEERTILTFDRDYGELIFKKNYRPIAGVVYFRFDIVQYEKLSEYCLYLFESHTLEFTNSLTVIDNEGFIRQKKY